MTKLLSGWESGDFFRSCVLSVIKVSKRRCAVGLLWAPVMLIHTKLPPTLPHTYAHANKLDGVMPRALHWLKAVQ